MNKKDYIKNELNNLKDRIEDIIDDMKYDLDDEIDKISYEDIIDSLDEELHEVSVNNSELYLGNYKCRKVYLIIKD